MLEQYLGADRFRNGIKLYLSKHKYANTETTDLWDAIEESSKEPVRQMMDSWIFQEGYPLVRVESDGTGNGIRLSQQRFLYSHNTKLEKATLFHVPIMIKAKTSDGIISKKVLLTDELHVDFNQKIDWVIVNEGGHGFYRVMYSNDLLQILTSNYKGIMSSSERFNLVSDTWAATVAGLKSLDDYLEFIHLLTDENDKNVWTAIVSSLYYLERILGPGEHEQFKTFVRDLISPELRRLGWQKRSTDDELVSQLRGALIATLGTTGDDKDTQKKAEEFYSEYKQDPGSISPDLVSAILNILAHVGNKKRYDEFSAAYKEAKSPQEEDRYRQAMAAFNDPQLLTTTLDRCLSGEIRSQNAPMVVGMILLNTNGRELAWQFIKTNWNKLLEKFPPPLIGRMCGGIVGLVTPKFLKETTQFFEQNEVKQAKKEISQYLEKLKIAVEMAERESKTFSELRKK
jgi:puromycin-sensitive aminopeptidase